MVKFERVTPEALRYVADNMREADRVEIMAASGQTPIQSLTRGHRISTYSAAAYINGKCVGILGLVKPSLITKRGVPWLLGTNQLFSHGKTLTSAAREGVREMLTVCPSLSNYVHCENKRSIKWLKLLGFRMEEPQEYGVNGEMFMKFTMEADDV